MQPHARSLDRSLARANKQTNERACSRLDAFERLRRRRDAPSTHHHHAHTPPALRCRASALAAVVVVVAVLVRCLCRRRRRWWCGCCCCVGGVGGRCGRRSCCGCCCRRCVVGIAMPQMPRVGCGFVVKQRSIVAWRPDWTENVGSVVCGVCRAVSS